MTKESKQSQQSAKWNAMRSAQKQSDKADKAQFWTGIIFGVPFIGLVAYCSFSGEDKSAKKAESRLAIQCEESIRSRLNHPSAADFDWGYSASKTGDETTIYKSFSAKNSFNLETKHEALCIFNGRNLDNIIMREVR